MADMESNTEPTGITLKDVTFYVTSFLMIFAPIIGYVDQVIKFRMLKSSEGYANKISLILLVSNTFRIFFWFGKHFSLVLVYQSIVMMVMQIILLISSLKYKNKHPKSDKFTWKNIWEWPYISDYFQFYTTFVIFLGILTPLVGYENILYFEILGILSAATEASLQLPQIYKNFILKSGSSLSYVLVATWLFGDVFKTGYLIKLDSPMQMVVCGVVQVFFDIIIILQVFCYNKEREDNIVTELHNSSRTINTIPI